MSDKDQVQRTHQIIPDPYRYVNLGLFILAAFANGIPCQAFAGVGPVIAEIYKIPGIQTNANSLFYPIMYIFMILPANYVIDVKGLKIGTLICQGLMCLGLALRCLINLHFYLFLFGTFFCSLGFCFTIGAANKFPNTWFLDKQIFIVKSLILFIMFAADTIGYFMSTAVISKQSSKQDVQKFFIIQSAVLILFHILNALFFRDLPKNPQNYSSQVKRQEYWKNLKKLFFNKNYRKIFFAVSFVFTSLSIVFVGVAWIGEAYNITTQQCGYILIIANAAGLVGCAGSGLFLKNQYKLKCKMFVIGAFVGFLMMWIGFEIGQFWFVCISAGVNGLFIFPFLTTIMDFSSQATFPIGQATSGGSILFGGQTFGFCMIILFSLYIDDNVTIQKGRVTQGLLLVLLTVGYIFLHFSKEDLKRNEYEERIKVEQKVSFLSSNKSYLSD